MKKSPKTSKAAKVPKGLKGYEEISQSEELKAFLPEGSQIMPGPYGGTTIMIPRGFSPEIPNFRGPWAEIRKEIYRFEVMAGRDGTTPMPAANRCTDKINKKCDQWIKDFYKTKDRWELEPSKDIAPWLIARAMMAGMFACMEDTHGLRPPTGKLETIMCDLLITFWNEQGRYGWHGIHPDASMHSE